MVLPDSDGISRVPPYSGSTPEDGDFNYRAVTVFGGPFQVASSTVILGNSNGVSYNPKTHASWFGLIPFRSPLLRKSHLLSLPSGTEMFQFPELPSVTYEFSDDATPLRIAGFPIRTSPSQRLLTARRGISVFVPSFFGS